MTYNSSDNTYIADWTGSFGPWPHQKVKVWYPTKGSEAKNASYPVVVSTFGATGNERLDHVAATDESAQKIYASTHPAEHAFLEAGYAVAVVGYGGVYVGETSPATLVTDDPYTGVLIGYTGAEWQQRQYTNCFKDFGRGIQFLRYSNETEKLDLDPNKFVGFGQEHGANVVSFGLFNEDLLSISKGYGSVGWEPWHDTSHRLNAGYMANPLPYWSGVALAAVLPDWQRFFPVHYDVYQEGNNTVYNYGIAVRAGLADAGTIPYGGALDFGFFNENVRKQNAAGAPVIIHNRANTQFGIEYDYTVNNDLTFTSTDSEGSYKLPTQNNAFNPNTAPFHPWFGTMLYKRLIDNEDAAFHTNYSRLIGDVDFQTGSTQSNWDTQPSATFSGISGSADQTQLHQYIINWMDNYFYPKSNLDQRPDYFLDVYGDATIAYVPAVTNYRFAENLAKRGQSNLGFRWEEVRIPLGYGQTGGILNYVMPDQYMIQITPDIGWHETLGMFNDPGYTEEHNPHLVNFGPFSISHGTLTDHGDSSVSVEITADQFNSAVIPNYSKYLWRAVPFGDGNPGLGGFPQKFEYITTLEQLRFTVDKYNAETKKAAQIISGTKSPRVNITVDGENTPNTVIEQTETSWKVTFLIDRPQVKFTIVATDIGGSGVGKHVVDLEFDSFGQYEDHVWNTFDGFALMASLERLPGETNDELKERTVDAFVRKGGTHYNGLISGINRELGRRRHDSAIKLARAKNNYGFPNESQFTVESNHTRCSISSPNMVIYDEVQKVDTYYNTVNLTKRIREIESIKLKSGKMLTRDMWHITDHVDGNEIKLHDTIQDELYITYSYKEDIIYKQSTSIADVVDRLNAIKTPSGLQVVKATFDLAVPPQGRSEYLYRSFAIVDRVNENYEMGWSPVGLFKMSDEEYKWSFADDNNMFFNSEFYKFVLELKSKTNTEWGFVVADQDFWDAVDSDQYGRDSLPIVFDPELSHFITAVPMAADNNINIDPWKAYGFSYFFEKALIRNVGYTRDAFKSGVGYKKDCAVSVAIINVSADDNKINQNPIAVKKNDQFAVNKAELGGIILDF